MVCERGLAQMQRGADVEVVQTCLEQAGRVSIGIGHFCCQCVGRMLVFGNNQYWLVLVLDLMTGL